MEIQKTFKSKYYFCRMQKRTKLNDIINPACEHKIRFAQTKR